MENFKLESRYLKLCHEFRAFIICMKAAFYRPNKKFLICLLIMFVEYLFQNMRFKTLF